ncbi:MAG TPA: hypothetical protein VES02_05120 [Dermatophilaceae bacterium]|nr:hypothetical protein [Dermatophilaceae bacterium]
MNVQHEALTFAFYPPTITPLTLSTATQLDNHHRATLPRNTSRLRRTLATALSAVRHRVS